VAALLIPIVTTKKLESHERGDKRGKKAISD